MGTWVLLFAMWGSWSTQNEFVSTSSQEFKTEQACKDAAKAYADAFNTTKSYNAKGICVPKGD